MTFKLLTNVIFIGITTLLFSCNEDGYTGNKFIENNPNSIKIKIDPTKAKEIFLNEFVDSISIIKLENNPDAILGQIDKMETSNNLMFFMDRFSGTITCFDINGKFKYKISKRGRGPEEYIDLEYFYIDNDNESIVISERSRKRLLKYDINTGKFISALDVGYYIEELIKVNDRIMLSSDEPQKAKLMLFDSTLKKTYYTCFPYNKGIGDYAVPNIFSKYNSRVLYTHAFDDVIYEVGLNAIKPIVNINFGKYIIKDSFFKGNMSKILEKRAEFFQNKYASFIHELHETKDFISFMYAYDKNFYQIFIFKYSNKVLNIKSIKSEDLLIDIPMPQATYKNMFASILYPQEINKPSNKNPLQLIEAIGSINNDDNAFILLFSIKK